MLVVVTARHAPLAVVLVVLAVTKFCLGGILPNSTAETMAPFARRAGSASALMGMAQMVLGALAAALLASLVLSPAVGMSTVMLVATRPEPRADGSPGAAHRGRGRSLRVSARGIA